MNAGSWIIGLISGVCIMLAAVLAGERWKYANEIESLKVDANLQSVAGRDEIETIRTQYSKALRICSAKLEAIKAVK